MSSNENDSINLKPYFQLIKKVINSFRVWMKRKFVFILILFTGLVLLMWGREFFSDDRYSSQGWVESELLKHTELVSLINAVSNNVNGSQMKGSGRIEGPDYFLDRIVKMEYELSVSEADSILFEHNSDIFEKNNIEIRNTLNPIRLTLKLESNNDSIGFHLIEYMNQHGFVSRLRDKETFRIEKRISDIQKQLEDIDSIKFSLSGVNTNLKSKNVKNELSFYMGESQSLIDLFKLRDELSSQLVVLQTEFLKLEGAAIKTIDGFSKPSIIKSSSVKDVKRYVLLFVLSILIIAGTSFIRKPYKD